MSDDITEAEFREETARKGSRSIPIVIALAVALFGVVPFLFFGGGFKGSQPYQDGIDAANRSVEVTRALGNPVEPGWPTTGSLSLNGLSGEADLRIPVHGPNGRGTLYVAGRRENGQWNYWTFAVELKDSGKIVELIQP